MSKCWNLLLIIFISLPLSAKTSAALSAKKSVDLVARDRVAVVIDKYSKANFVKMSLNKTIRQVVLEKSKSSSGELWVRKGGKLRFEIAQPEKSLVILDGKNIWSVEYIPQELGGGLNILMSAAESKKQPVIATLFGSKKILNRYSVKSVGVKADVEELQFDAKSSAEDVQSMTLWIDTKRQAIVKVFWLDQLKNEIQLEFSGIQFLDKGDESLFRFTPPKGSKVIKE